MISASEYNPTNHAMKIAKFTCFVSSGEDVAVACLWFYSQRDLLLHFGYIQNRTILAYQVFHGRDSVYGLRAVYFSHPVVVGFKILL